jgi:hypothetical protein
LAPAWHQRRASAVRDSDIGGAIGLLIDGNDDTFPVFTLAKDLNYQFDLGPDFNFPRRPSNWKDGWISKIGRGTPYFLRFRRQEEMGATNGQRDGTIDRQGAGGGDSVIGSIEIPLSQHPEGQ